MQPAAKIGFPCQPSWSGGNAFRPAFDRIKPPLRLLFASRPDALGRCLAVIVRAIQTDLAHRARLSAGSGARTGVVILNQRFGGALNLNIHLHMLILDGVYTTEQNGPRFHRVGAPDPQTLERLSTDGAGQVVYQLETPFRDGTTHILFTPQDFIARPCRPARRTCRGSEDDRTDRADAGRCRRGQRVWAARLGRPGSQAADPRRRVRMVTVMGERFEFGRARRSTGSGANMVPI
jgi:hypothetical protein